MEEPDIFDALRAEGIDADDPDVRGAVRDVVNRFEQVRARDGHHAARRHLEAVRHAVAYMLRNPDVEDMSSFEDEFDDES